MNYLKSYNESRIKYYHAGDIVISIGKLYMILDAYTPKATGVSIGILSYTGIKWDILDSEHTLSYMRIRHLSVSEEELFFKYLTNNIIEEIKEKTDIDLYQLYKNKIISSKSKSFNL